MVHLRIAVPAQKSERVVDLLEATETVSSLARIAGASRKPRGDLILCDVAREDASIVIGDLREMGVGRDGSIRPPPSGRETQAITSVPGLTVIDNFGGSSTSGRPASAGGSPAVDEPPAGPSPDRSAQPKVKMVTGSDDRGSAAPQKKAAAAPPPQEKKSETPKKVAAASPSSSSSSGSSGPRPTGAGYVAVLASVPASESSRIDALTQFADMQQQYGNILSNKTPDIQEANLGAKGTYHRLLVGPPGSRDSANSVCNQLKAQGYSGCWITAY